MASDQDLHEHIQQLHEELEAATAVDAEARKQLQELLSDIRSLLSRADEPTDHTPQSLAERLEDATRDFEASHPTLSATVGRVIDTLSNLGI